MSTFSASTLAAESGKMACPSAITKKGNLVAGIRQDNPPHSFINAKGEWVGFDVDIAQGLADYCGVKLKRVPVDELTRISFLQNGKIDIAAASMSHTYKRDQQVDFSQTYFWSSQTFMVRKGDVGKLADLVGKKVGMNRGSHAIGNWEAWHKKNKKPFDGSLITEFSNKQAAVAALKSGSIAGYAEDYEVLASFARGNDELAILSGAIGMKQDGIGVKENNSKLRDSVNYGLQYLEKTGSWQTMYDRWFGPDTPTPVPVTHRIEVWPGG
ncbi:MAG: transporter substrate-binding domain-containing protein [Pseudomonadota bacterium]